MPSCRSFLLSELETDPGVPTFQAGPGVDRSDERYKAMYFARRLGERPVKNPTSPFYFIQVLSFLYVIQYLLDLVSCTGPRQYDLFYRE